MAEPEEVISEAARHAVIAARRLWRRGAPALDGSAGLAPHKRRLELLLAATFGADLPIRKAQPPAPLSFLRKLYGAPKSLRAKEALPGTDGAAVFLPDAPHSPSLSTDRLLRLLALQQGGRARRGSAARRWIPEGELARCLYELAEAAEVDRGLVKELPGLGDDLLALRRDLLLRRPPLEKLRAPERRLESLYRSLLEGGAAELPAFPTPAATRAWAEETAARWEGEGEARFRGFLRDLFVGALRKPEFEHSAAAHAGAGSTRPQEEESEKKDRKLARRPDVREDVEGEDEGEPGPWMLQVDDPHEHVEDPMGLQRPTDRGADGEAAADSLSELQEARVVRSPERAQEVFVSDDPPQLRRVSAGGGCLAGVVYPEWDHRRSAYDPAGATVWIGAPAPGPAGWAEEMMARRRLLFEQVRRRFEALRPRRVHLGRQEDGEELDLDALVEGHADRAAGLPPPERIYRTTLPLRRDLAISLLVDISGSTDAWIGEEQRIVDVEKEALLLCCHALAALGDPFSIEAFSGEGAHGVVSWRVKGFDEAPGREVERRIAGLEPDNYTRAGAALRHATAGLAARREQRRLLLLLSDGKPNDEDSYGGVYGIEDMRQAVQEAVAAGISVFCLTVDREAPRYLPRIFGPWRYTTLAHAKQLPLALVEVLRHLIRR